jgi:hypothetical protein
MRGVKILWVLGPYGKKRMHIPGCQNVEKYTFEEKVKKTKIKKIQRI